MEGTASAAADGVEVEWQFDASDLSPAQRWLADLPQRASELPALPVLIARALPSRRLTDRYLDTEDWRLGRAGMVLRVRRRGRNREATLKDTRPAAGDGLRRRLEVTEPLPPGDGEVEWGDGPVGHRVRALVGDRPLRGLFDVRTRRQPFSLRAPDGDVAELALDDTVIAAEGGRAPVRLLRVEVEVVPEWVDALRPLVDELRRVAELAPAEHSKFETGLRSAGLSVPGPPDLGPTNVRRSDTVGALAVAVLRAQVGALLAHEPGTRLGEDPEELHAMRVATRRLRAAMALFADALSPWVAGLRAELGWIAGVLGAVRDLDVQIERTAQLTVPAIGSIGHQLAGGEPLRAILVAERATARAELLVALDSPRWDGLRCELVSLARREPDPAPPLAQRPAVAVAADLLLAHHQRAAKAARRALRTGDPSDFHRLRIRCKGLRYALEFTAPLYGSVARRFARKLAALQDTLGALQDTQVARGRLADLALGTALCSATASATATTTATLDGARPLELPAATVFAMGAVAEQERQESDRLLAALPDQLDVLTGRAWDALTAAIERRRQRAPRR